MKRPSKGRRALDNAPDWLGCGRKITQESWDAFTAARRAYYSAQEGLYYHPNLDGPAEPIGLSMDANGNQPEPSSPK